VFEASSAPFDNLGRVTQSQQTTDGATYGVPMTYTYNLSGAMVEQKYPSGRVVKNVLDNEGDLAIVQSKKNANSGFFHYADSFTYTAAGAVSSMQLGNGKWESTSFNSRLQPTQIALGTVQGGTDKVKLNFNYGTTANNGNVLSQTITVPTTGTAAGFTAVQNYSYDSLNRVKSAVENINGNQTPSWKQTFTFDRYGNRNFDTANTTTIPTGCAVAVCNPQVDPATNKLIGYQFDNSGNTKVDATNRQFIYDGENKQVEVKDQYGASIGKYYFDGDGKRVKKISATETTIFVYNASGQFVAEYSTQISQTPQVSYLTSDHLGSSRINTDANGNIIARHDFLPFGEEIQRANYGSDSMRQKFTGYERDIETDLDFAQARMYVNRLGRFTAVDPLLESGEPIKPQTWNRYVYCLNNPLNLVDPDGQKWKFADENLQKAFEEAVKAKGDKAWKAYQAIDKAKGTINVGFGDLGKTKFGNTSVSFNTSFETKNGKIVAGTTKLESVSGTITIGNNKEALDTSNFTDLVSASAHEFTHVLSGGNEAGVPGFSGLVPADGVTQKEEKAGKQSFPIESAAFDAQVQAEKTMIAKGNKPVSPDTSLGRANADFGILSTPTEKYDYLSKIYPNFKQPRPGPQPPKKK
jgi:RHS repeat-associated protein